MKPIARSPGLDRRALLSTLALLPAMSAPLFSAVATAQTAADAPLPSWNDGAAKQAIIDFVRATTERSSPNYVAPEERIATFDQDGTLWVEHPMYTQVIYCLDRVPAVVAKKPELKNVEPFKTVLSGNREAIAKLPMTDLEKILAATLTGMTVEEFKAEAKKWLETAQASALEAALHRAHLSADARSAALPARQWLQDLHRDRRRPGLRARVRREGLRHPARAGRRHRGRNEIRLRQGRQAVPDQGAEAPAQRQQCRQGRREFT